MKCTALTDRKLEVALNYKTTVYLTDTSHEKISQIDIDHNDWLVRLITMYLKHIDGSTSFPRGGSATGSIKFRA